MKFAASLLPHDEVTVFLSPREIAVAHGKADAPADRRACPQAGPEDWSGAVQALAHWAGEPRIGRRRTGARLVLSNHWIRYAVLPADRGRLRRDETLAFARALIAERFGQDWESAQIRVGQGVADEGVLAAAVPSRLLEALEAVLHEHALGCLGIIPLFSHDLDSARLDSDASHACYASIEPGRLVLAMAGPDGWSWIHSPLSGENPTLTLERELAREQALMPPQGELPLFLFSHEVRIADRLDPALRVVLRRPG